MDQQKLPNSITVLVLGIISIITICCGGIISVITGGIGVMLSKKDEGLYQSNPSIYSGYQNLKIGKILCWIGLILGLCYFAYTIYMFDKLGWDAFANPELMQERLKDLQ